MKVQTAYIRKGRIIRDAVSKQLLDPPFHSINAAKRWSRIEQKAHGGLGAGYVRVDRS